MLLTEDHDTWAMNRTQEVWPVNSALLTIDRNFQRVNWFSVNPWELNNSLSFLFQRRDHTWEPVCTGFRQAQVWVFQNLMQRSLSPPPDASKLLWNGHQARALIDDVWSSNRCSHWFWFRGLEEAAEKSQIHSELSLPPLASCPERDHFRPQTSSSCPWYVWIMCERTHIIVYNFSILSACQNTIVPSKRTHSKFMEPLWKFSTVPWKWGESSSY